MYFGFDPESFKKGEEFQKFVEKKLFPERHYVLVHRTHDYEQNSRRFVEDTLQPDFTFRIKDTNQEFFVEAKWRQDFNDEDKLELFKIEQLERFHHLDSIEKPLFLVVGYNGTPNDPDNISLIPLKTISYPGLFRSVISKYCIPKEKILPETMNQYFEKKFSGEEKLPAAKENPGKIDLKKFKVPALAVSISFVLVLLFLYLLPYNKATIDNPSPLKENIARYYQASNDGDLKTIGSLLNDNLDSWYGKQNMTMKEVMKEIRAYNSAYPYRRAEVLWNTYVQEELPDGATKIQYELNYITRKKDHSATKSFHLIIYSIWGKDGRMRSISEVRL